jgi:tetratricopeptide (TPR) repeat protein
MVNKALALFQARQDFESAGNLCQEALQLDPTCDVAVATLAQLLLQQNKVEEAVVMFSRSAELARTEPELVNALTYEHVRADRLDLLLLFPSSVGGTGPALPGKQLLTGSFCGHSGGVAGDKGTDCLYTQLPDGE